MVFKINISSKEGKTYKVESSSESLIGKELGSKFDGKLIMPELDGYEFEITGASDKSGFTAFMEVEGIGHKKMLLRYGKGMKKRPKREGKKKQSNETPGGLKLRKNVRGKVIAEDIKQINVKPVKIGSKPLAEIFAPKESPAEEKTE